VILAIRTDSPLAILCLLDADGKVLQQEQWQADRQLAKELLGKLEALLQTQQTSWNDVRGLIVYRGPGSFTGLRIGITVMNTIAYAQSIPIVGVMGENWREEGVQRLAAGENDKVVLPEYGAEARITKPRK